MYSKMAKIDFAFLVLALGVVGINLPYLGTSFFLQHDTLYNFQLFYSFYNEFFYHHTIAQWIPYGSYGIPAALFQLGVITPTQYLFGFVGGMAGIKDALMLFKGASLLEQFTFLTGMYLLSRELFKKNLIIIFVCIASFCSLEWLYNIFWNFRLYEFFPLAFYFLIIFLRTRKSFYFWLVCLIGLVWSMGMWFYPAFLFFFVGFVMAAVMFPGHPGAWRDLRPRTKADFTVMVFFLVFSAFYLLFFKNSFDQIALLHRVSTTSAANSLAVFQHYGKNATFDSLVSWFFLGNPLYTSLGAGRDNTAYVGLATVVYFIWAAAFVRDRYFITVLTIFTLLVWMSFGGLIAAIIYHFPAMKFYRHVGLVYSLVKICVCLGAGWGIRDFMNCPAHSRIKRLFFVLLICLLLLDTSRQFQLHCGMIVPTAAIYFTAFVLFIAVRFFVSSRIKNPARSKRVLEYAFAFLLIFAISMDTAVIRMAFMHSWPKLSSRAEEGLRSIDVNPLPFAAQRGQKSKGRQALAALLQEAAHNQFSAQYETLYAFAQADPCNETPYTGIMTADVNEFFHIKFLSTEDRNRIRGCSESKLRLLGNDKFFNDSKDQVHFMETSEKFGQTALLIASPQAKPPEDFGSHVNEGLGNVTVESFDSDHLNVMTDVRKKGGAWLLYADAYYPGWHAYIDGFASPVYQAFIAFKAVFVPEGKHEVKLVFRNKSTFILSYVIALFGVAAGAGCLLVFLMTLAGRLNLLDPGSSHVKDR